MTTDHAENPMPIKCGSCDRPMDVPVFCANCSTLVAAEETDYFRLLNVPRQYDLDAQRLRQAYLNLSRAIHPDRFAGRSDDAARLSLRVSSQINRAYEVLSDPLRRAEYLLELSGGRPASEDKNVSPEVLAETLELREEIDVARASGDRAALERIRDRIGARCASRADAIAALARGLPGDETVRNRLRLLLNDVKYDLRMLEQV